MTIRYYERVTVTTDVRGADGRLRVQAGAAGTVYSVLSGHLGVLFDDGPAYVELSGCGQRFAEIPATSVAREGWFFTRLGRRYRVLASFTDSEQGTHEANEYMEQHPGTCVLAVTGGQILLAGKQDAGEPVIARGG